MSVKVTKHPETGNVFTPNKEVGKDGKQYGSYRVEETFIDNSGAVTRVKTKSALKSILASDFEKIKDVLVHGAILDGRVRTIESLTQEKGMKPKMAGSDENALPCLQDGKQIYSRTELCTTGEADELVAHTNGAEISAAAKAKQAQAING